MHTRIAALLTLVLLGSSAVRAAPPLPPLHFEDRWVYASHNLLVDKNVEDLNALIERAGKSGYNGLVLADYKFNILERMPPRYFKNVERVRAAAAKAKVEIIPCVFPIGYSDGLLAHDPNLAEGLPVKDAPFVVKGRKAQLDAAAAPSFHNGDLEEVKGDRFLGFSFQDDPGQTSFADRKVVHHGKVSCRMQDVAEKSSSGNCRLIQHVKVRPHACYRFSGWVKTQDLNPTGAFHFTVIGVGKGNPPLTFHEAHLKHTQDWTYLEVVFNSLEEKEVNLYVGQWAGKTGKLWLDEMALDEVALVNVLRRPGCPLDVVSADGKTTYEEGKDFLAVRDAKLGQDPYAGQFSFHRPDLAIQLTPESRIKDGDRLRVSWYHPVIIHGEQVACCLSDPKVNELLRDQARRVHDLFKPTTFFMSHDEIRVANWCKTCEATRQTPGQLLAANVRRCVAILKEINPKARIVVWSDMFDPNHNAVDRYYLVNGSWKESWQGLPADVIIANWNGGKAAESLKWFSQCGHSQIIAGYYDSDLADFKKWTTAARGVPGVRGFMYTTWQNKYIDLEDYGKALREQK